MNMTKDRVAAIVATAAATTPEAAMMLTPEAQMAALRPYFVRATQGTISRHNADDIAQCLSSVGAAWVAREFSERLHRLLGAHVAEVVALNRAQPDPDVCHSNDFCDAGTVMQEAFAACGLEVFTPDGRMDDQALVIWNSAWHKAKAAEFNAAIITAGETDTPAA